MSLLGRQRNFPLIIITTRIMLLTSAGLQSALAPVISPPPEAGGLDPGVPIPSLRHCPHGQQATSLQTHAF